MADISSGFVCFMGMGTVFIGLICIVILCMVMSLLLKGKRTDSMPPSAPVMAPAAPAGVTMQPIANKQELIAGICAVIGEELGTDVSNIRVLSFKKIV